MRTVVGLCFAMSLLVLLPQKAIASCVVLPDSCKYVAEADALFEATVASVQIRQLPDGYLERVFRLQDVRTWKGRAEDVVRSNGESGHGLEVGARYIIDAGRSQHDGLLRVRLCSATVALEEAGGFYDYVRSLSSPPAGGYLWGRVEGREGDANGGGYDAGPGLGRGPESEPVEGALVSIAGPIALTVATGADGTYSVNPLPEGEYTISVALPPGRRDLKAVAPRSVRLIGPRACADVSFVAYGLVRSGGAIASRRSPAGASPGSP
jgi:hypothetical protein